MKITFLLFSLLLLYPWHTGNAQSGNASLVGTWNIRQVELRQTVDNGAPTLKVFNPGDDTSSSSTFVRLPVKITFAGSNVTFEYPNRKSAGTYRLQGNTLNIGFSTQMVDYTYILSEGNLRLSQTVEYVINEGETVHRAKEEYTFYGQK
ncbi:MAG: hypothetical protein LBJ58_04585 [Tannerellaceae bacterium]|jgi:hypothetical protein|nr:hypothetical protein [Tannerellaceae bacterium]